jgi:osmoprotectant transport system ATP-binding protein
MLTLQGVSKRYGDSTVLRPTDLSIMPGKTTVLIGPSGCGKSTLIRLIIGLIQPNSGKVLFEEALLTDRNMLSLRHRFGYVIQEGGLFPHLTARGNVILMARHLGWERARVESRLQDLAMLTRFPEEGLDRYPIQLSGGQRQRVALMRALMLDPDILLLDEPLGALDPMIRFDLQNELKQIFQSLGKTVVMVTHDIGEAAYLGDVIVLLRDGEVIQKGTIQDLIERPADPFVGRFIQAQRSPLSSLGEDH